ncbi:unnamed protein product [Candida verbasci]|uniref:RNA helicase n=1 Tax=Candida verbasci TaxID=1227364 RepID=A0A9W4TXI4_9ASCO|nr:unnamed protein product [Candida verbasci]
MTQSNDNNTNNESKEEKLRKRREQLLLWRQKKEQERNEDVKQDDNEDIKKIRQQRIEQWKKSKQLNKSEEKSPTPTVENNIKTKISINKKKTIIKETSSILKKRARPMFQDDVESNLKPKFKKPSLDFNDTEDNDNDVDDVDKFLETLNDEEIKESEYHLSREEDENIDDLDDENDFDDLLANRLTKLQNKTKNLQEIDHSKENYEPFNKVFYQEPYEMSKLSPKAIDQIRLELDGLSVKGNNPPNPILKWSHLSLPNNLYQVITNKLQFASPTSIQAQALPTIMSGRDLIGVAKTGSGKTLSYVLPMLRHVQDQRPLKEGEGPIALILSPTRELAIQIQKEILQFTKQEKKLRVCCCYGGSNIETQINELKKGVEIVVGTPGRIIDLLAANSSRLTNLKRCTYVVIDEADRMFDLGFEPQVTKIFTQIRPNRQTILFSATLPKKMEILAEKLLTDPVKIIVGGVSIVAKEISQTIILFEDESNYQQEKFDKLTEILTDFKGHGKVLIFVEKQNDCDELQIKLMKKGFACVSIHGGKEQIDRKYAIKEFSDPSNDKDLLIATSIAARGLDVKNLNLVINFDPPNHLEDYVHRVGRTGRAGQFGESITFVFKNQQKEISSLVKALTLSEQEIDPKLLEINNQFLSKVKSGKEKFNFGFGGKGLDNLQDIRESKLKLEKQIYGETNDEEINNKPDLKSKQSTPSFDLPEFNIIEGNSGETSGPDKCKFYCKITINDLPQKVRWNIVQRENLSKILEVSKTSITTKGQFYQLNQVPTNDQPPKLYLLLEGLTYKSIQDAIELIKEKIIEGIELVDKDEAVNSTGKYKV